MLRHCVVIITRYCAIIALALVVGFTTGVFIQVVKLKATGADVSFIWRPVTPRYQVADRAEMTGQTVAQIIQPPTPPPEITKPPTPPPKITKPPTPPPSPNAGVPALQPAPSITPKNPPASVSESAASSLSALQNAAEDGDPIAEWKLGRMYAEGNGVAQNDLLAFDYFSRIANAHIEQALRDNRDTCIRTYVPDDDFACRMEHLRQLESLFK